MPIIGQSIPYIGPQCLQLIRTIPYNWTSMPPISQTIPYNWTSMPIISQTIPYNWTSMPLGICTYTSGCLNLYFCIIELILLYN